MAGEGNGADRIPLRQRLARRKALNQLSDVELVRRFTPQPPTAAQRRDGIDVLPADNEALKVWQNRDPVRRARPGGGGFFKFLKPIARAAGPALWTAGAVAIGGKLLAVSAGAPKLLPGAPSILPKPRAPAPGPIPTAARIKPALAAAVTPRAAQILTPTLEKPVSLLADIGSFAGNISRAVSAFRGSGPGGFGTPPISSHPGRNPTIGIMPVGQHMGASMLPALSSILRSPTVRGTAAGAAGALGIELLTRGGAQPKRRRMNPLNVKAARRAIRRIKAVRKITRDIEKSLPVRTVRRAAPAGHRARLSHK